MRFLSLGERAPTLAIMAEARFKRPESPYPRDLGIDADDETRVVDIYPGSYEDELRCGLSVQPLREHSAGPSFDAISYVWGDWRDLGHIHLEDIPNFPVTKNLSLAMRRLRKTDSVVRFWIDQISIDQQCKSERKRQVKQIGRIFHQARQVYLWLGEVRDKLFRSPERALISALNDKNPMVDVWWSRAWVLEEFALARKDPIVKFGGHERPWRELTDAISNQATIPTGQSAIFSLHSAKFDSLRDPNFSRNLFTLSIVLNETDTLDPRDKVYCVLPSLPDDERRRIMPDYDKPIPEVFAEATYASIASSGSIGIMSLIAGSRPTVKGNPTWAVDFTFPSRGDTLRLIPTPEGSFAKKVQKWGYRPFQEAKMIMIPSIFGFEQAQKSWCRRHPQTRAQASHHHDQPYRLIIQGLDFDSISSIASVDLSGRNLAGLAGLQRCASSAKCTYTYAKRRAITFRRLVACLAARSDLGI